MRPALAGTLAAFFALGAPMNAGIPPLDTGRREPRVVLIEPLVSDEDRARAAREAISKAASKRARRAARGW